MSTRDQNPVVRRYTNGFTLIEVMLSMAILGIGLTVLIASASRCLAVVKAARLYEDARHLIARVEIEHPFNPEDVEPGVEQGHFSGDYSAYRWRREIELVETGEDPEKDGLHMISIRILWTEKSKQAYEEVVTYLHVPPDET